MGYKNRKKKIITAIIVIGLILAIIFTPILKIIGGAFGYVLSPIQTGATRCVNAIGGGFQYLSRIKNVDKENQMLKEQVAEMKQQLAEYERLKTENNRLVDLLELKNRYDKNNAVSAEIIAKNGGNLFHVFTINKGKNSGISVNDFVVNTEGLVGRICECGPNYAKVTAIIDSEHSVSGMVSRTGDFVQLDGDVKLMKQGLCTMSVITEDATVIIGDTVETSGMGGVYPKGIAVGTVQKFEENKEGIGTYAILKPYVDFKHLNEVIVVKHGGNK